jgi:hypothetical protein
VALDAFDELSFGELVYVPVEPGPPQDAFELCEQQRAYDDTDPVFGERAQDEVRCAAALTDECGDEDSWVDYDPGHPAPRSRRAACSSS